MGPLHDPVTWYKIIYTGEQVAQWDFQNNATRTSSPGPAFVLEVPLRNLLTSIYYFVPCDRIVQRAHCRGETKTGEARSNYKSRREMGCVHMAVGLEQRTRRLSSFHTSFSTLLP